MTYRERREARADRLRGWAEKRETTASASLAADAHYHGDWAFATQPGRIPERDRVNAREHRAYQSLNKADSMRSRADSIEAAAAKAIYSDDEDAVERLTEKLAALEAERARWTAYNASARKAAKSGGNGDMKLLDASQQRDLLRAITWSLPRPGAAAPAYVTANLSGNISRLRKRLAELS